MSRRVLLLVSVLASSAAALQPAAVPSPMPPEQASAVAGENTQQGAQHTLAGASSAYRAGDYAKASALWSSVLAQGSEQSVDPADILFNLGNAAVRRARPVEALGWYRACLKLAPRRSDARFNATLASTQASLDQSQGSDVTATLGRLISSVTAAESGYASMLLALFAGVCTAVWSWRKDAWLRRLAVASAALALVVLVPYIARELKPNGQEWFVRAPKTATVHSEPRKDAASLFELRAGDQVLGIERVLDWIKIDAESKGRGWMQAGDLMPLDPPFGPIP